MNATLTTLLLAVLGAGPSEGEPEPIPVEPDVPCEIAACEEPDEETNTDARFIFKGRFLTVMHLRNDSDFHRTPRYHEPAGQTEGQVATFFHPRIGAAVEGFKLIYEAELGWNVWSRNDPDQPNQFFPAHQPGLLLRHKQLWASYRFCPAYEIKVGYQHFHDPSNLFLDHFGGAASLDITLKEIELSLIVGQLPDTTYEGVEIEADNFVTDSVFGGVKAAVPLGDVTLDAAVYGLGDFRLIGRPLRLGAAVLGIRFQEEDFKAWAHAVGQVGSWANSAVNGEDQLILGWAFQGGLAHRYEDFEWGFNAFYLSPDDDHHGNSTLYAFFGSAKNRSASLMLTEDEYRDRYDNLDERIGTAWGPFFFNRAGLFVADLVVAYQGVEWYTPRLLLAFALNSNKNAAMGHGFVGFELGLLNDFRFGKHVSVFLNLQLLVPGQAASVFVNDVELEATGVVGGGELGFKAWF